MDHPISPGDRVKVTGGAFVIGMGGRVAARNDGRATLVVVDLDNGQRVTFTADQVVRVPYVARHLGAPDTAWKAQTRERLARALTEGTTRGTLTPRGFHAAYKRYQPLPADVRRPVERPSVREAA